MKNFAAGGGMDFVGLEVHLPSPLEGGRALLPPGQGGPGDCSPMSTTESVTELLLAWSDGDDTAVDRLVPLVEGELRRLAKFHMRRESPGHTLQTTALVNELYLKLVDQTHARWYNRAHFFAVAAQMMRRILVDHARRHMRGKRGGGAPDAPLDEAAVLSAEKSEELLALDEALDRLAKLDPPKARVVVLRHFGGLSVEETAQVLKVSEVTVMRHWGLAKAWLRRELSGGGRDSGGDSFAPLTPRN